MEMNAHARTARPTRAALAIATLTLALALDVHAQTAAKLGSAELTTAGAETAVTESAAVPVLAI